MLVIDDKGNSRHNFLHIYAEFEGTSGPFAGVIKYLSVSRGYGEPQTYSVESWKRIEIFPPTFPEPRVGNVYTDKTLKLDASTHTFVVNGNERVRDFFDVDGTYGFLAPRDVVALAASATDKNKDTVYVQITHVRKITVNDYVEGPNGQYQKESLERRLDKELKASDVLTVFEFKRTYEWKFNRARKT